MTTTCCPKTCPCRSPREGLLTDADVLVLSTVADVITRLEDYEADTDHENDGDTMLQALGAVRDLVPRRQLARLLSFPILGITWHRGGCTVLYWATMRQFVKVIEWLVAHRVCLHTGLIQIGSPGRCEGREGWWDPKVPRRQPCGVHMCSFTPMSTLWPMGFEQSVSHGPCHEALLHAGAHPSFTGRGKIGGDRRREGWWKAWHGREAKRLWLALMLD